MLAQVSTPSEGLTPGMYTPLYLALTLYVVLFVAGRVLDGRGNDQGSERMQDFAFLLLMATGVYVAVLAILAIGLEFALIVDMLQIIAVIVVFFAVLVTVLLLVELLVVRVGRRRRRGVVVPPADGD